MTTDPPSRQASTPRGGTLGLRLALAFLGVALGAIALLAGLTAAFAAADVSHLASKQRDELASAIAVAPISLISDPISPCCGGHFAPSQWSALPITLPV